MKKKVCFVVSQPGTARAFFKTPIEKLVKDFDVYLVADIKDKSQVEGLNLTDYKSIEIKRRPNINSDIKSLFQLYRYFKQNDFYVVHSMSSKASLLTAIAGKWARIPHRIRTFTGQIWCNMTGLKRLFFKCLDKLTVTYNTELLADGYPQRQYLIEQNIVKPDDIKVLANGSICGIDINKFKYNEQTRDAIRKNLSIENKIVFVFLGRLKREKGIDELIAAFEYLIHYQKDAFLLLVGPDEENYRAKLASKPTLIDKENILFYGRTDKPYDLLMAGDVFCMPSYREGFGLSVLEASCLGLPVICSDTYGMTDTLIDNVTGLKCKTKDVETLFNCMLRFYQDKSFRNQCGLAGHNRVIEKFSKEIVTEAWYNYYKGLGNEQK